MTQDQIKQIGEIMSYVNELEHLAEGGDGCTPKEVCEFIFATVREYPALQAIVDDDEPESVTQVQIEKILHVVKEVLDDHCYAIDHDKFVSFVLDEAAAKLVYFQKTSMTCQQVSQENRTSKPDLRYCHTSHPVMIHVSH